MYYIRRYVYSKGVEQKEGGRMTVSRFAKLVTVYEAGKKECSIAQILEVLKVVNILLCGGLYKLIRRFE